MQSPIKQQFDQSQQSIVAVDESTFTYLPKVSKAIGLSTLTMDQFSSKKLKNYQYFGLFLHGLDPVAFNRKVDPLPRCCFNCWSHEHRLLNCPKRLIGIFCCNCGRRCVRIDECPRCSRVFWELDASARQWLISYIPEGGQENATDCSEKDWSKYMDDTDKSPRRKNDSSIQKRRKGQGDSKGVELSDCESVSTLVSRTTDKDEGDNDEWWAGGKSKDNVEETLTQKQRTGVGSFKSPSTSEKRSPCEENLQKFHQLAKLKDNSNFENQGNLLGDSLNSTSHPFDCYTIPHIHVEDRDKVTDCSEEDWSKYENGISENISDESNSGKLRKREDGLKTEELIRCESEFVSRTTEESKRDTDNWWPEGSNKEETAEERLNPTAEEEKDNHESILVNEEDGKDKENVQMTLVKTESDCENQCNLLDEYLSATPSEEDEEDYDNIIVDEDEQLEESSIVGSTVRDFLDLLKAAKYLPLQQQNRIVLRYATECKKKF